MFYNLSVFDVASHKIPIPNAQQPILLQKHNASTFNIFHHQFSHFLPSPALDAQVASRQTNRQTDSCVTQTQTTKEASIQSHCPLNNRTKRITLFLDHNPHHQKAYSPGLATIRETEEISPVRLETESVIL